MRPHRTDGPVSAISNWYDYYRANGLVRAPHSRRSGVGTNAYWAARNYLPKADQVRASVFVVHGLEDYNVMPRAYASWWDELGEAGVTRKIWLHNGGHGGPGGNSGYQAELDRWMGHWLFGVDNGITDEPRADVQRPDGTYQQYADWRLRTRRATPPTR